MTNPDAVLNECFVNLVRHALSDQRTFFGEPVQPQVAANAGGALLQSYLHRWSSYVDISRSGNVRAARSVLCSMLTDIESDIPVRQDDVDRVLRIASWVEGSWNDIGDMFSRNG